eukprot:gene17574-42439_t
MGRPVAEPPARVGVVGPRGRDRRAATGTAVTREHARREQGG